jgi:hypothetical protein
MVALEPGTKTSTPIGILHDDLVDDADWYQAMTTQRDRTPTPLIDRTEAPLVVANVVERGPLDKVTVMQAAHGVVQSIQRRPGRWVPIAHGHERFVPEPVPYVRSDGATMGSPALAYSKEDVEAMIAAIKLGYATIGPDDVTLVEEPSADTVVEAIAKMVGLGMEVRIDADRGTVMVTVREAIGPTKKVMGVGFGDYEGLFPDRATVEAAFDALAWRNFVARREAEGD